MGRRAIWAVRSWIITVSFLYDKFLYYFLFCRSYDRPKMIESFQGKHIRDIACGTGHSAAVSVNGELFTWGQGEDGRLGHGDSNNQTKPKLVMF